VQAHVGNLKKKPLSKLNLKSGEKLTYKKNHPFWLLSGPLISMVYFR